MGEKPESEGALRSDCVTAASWNRAGWPGRGLAGAGGGGGRGAGRGVEDGSTRGDGAAFACPELGGAGRILKAANNLLTQNTIETTNLNVILLLSVTFLKVNFLNF